MIDLKKTIDSIFKLQFDEGYWWFALEANETIGSEFIFLMHFIDAIDKDIQDGICGRILDVQRDDGTWALYHNGHADLSTTIECYFALKLSDFPLDTPRMTKAREYILKSGGVEKARVFTRIHLACFGLVPWSSTPQMPPELILLPSWFPINIYEFSSWARATIVPLSVFCSLKPVKEIDKRYHLDELFINPVGRRNFSIKCPEGVLSWENFFIQVDRVLRFADRSPWKPFRKMAIDRCMKWTWEHVQRTEDIYPALAYCALAFKALGYANDAPEIQKPLKALLSFQQRYDGDDIPKLGSSPGGKKIHQQCCISPVWDTPWTVIALLEAGVSSDDPKLKSAEDWLIKKQILEVRGDWSIKNKNALPGGWSFEFENDFYPDVDDTIEVLSVLMRIDGMSDKKSQAIRRGVDWLLSMQNEDGGWGAFDKNQKLQLVNRIPFSDHGACLDPSSPDITGRMIEFLAKYTQYKDSKYVKMAVDYLWRTQEDFGGWFARWGINYIYGTWCVLSALSSIDWDRSDLRLKKAVSWLKTAQLPDGGWGESPASYEEKEYMPLFKSTPSQTAWGLIGLIDIGEARSVEVKRGIEFLLKSMNQEGLWDEFAYTGTGFPGHFYIRYHGYHHFFPLMALGKYNQILSPAIPSA